MIKIRNILTIVGFVCTVAAAPLMAQQAPESGRNTGGNAAPVSLSGTIPPGPPRLSPQFQHVAPRLASNSSSLAAAEGGQHVIVISTLALVLAAIIVVLLVVN